MLRLKILNCCTRRRVSSNSRKTKRISKGHTLCLRSFEEGSEAAREVAIKTLSEVRSAMKINYFDDIELINSQVESPQNEVWRIIFMDSYFY